MPETLRKLRQAQFKVRPGPLTRASLDSKQTGGEIVMPVTDFTRLDDERGHLIKL